PSTPSRTCTARTAPTAKSAVPSPHAPTSSGEDPAWIVPGVVDTVDPSCAHGPDTDDGREKPTAPVALSYVARTTRRPDAIGTAAVEFVPTTVVPLGERLRRSWPDAFTDSP